jgi:hypothetical protein
MTSDLASLVEARHAALAVQESIRRDRGDARKCWRLIALAKFRDPAAFRLKATDARLAAWPDDPDWFVVRRLRNFQKRGPMPPGE